MDYTKVYALSTTNGANGAHCPLVSLDHKDELEHTFNYQVRGEQIVELEISNAFVCEKKGQQMCEFCPFNKDE